MLDMPEFMENEDWYEWDVKKKQFVLTDKAPDSVKESYKQFIEDLAKTT